MICSVGDGAHELFTNRPIAIYGRFRMPPATRVPVWRLVAKETRPRNWASQTTPAIWRPGQGRLLLRQTYARGLLHSPQTRREPLLTRIPDQERWHRPFAKMLPVHL